MHSGWWVAADLQSLDGRLTSIYVGERSLMAISESGSVRVFDGICPHRGASLGRLGRFSGGDFVQCGFHGLKIGLGSKSRRPLCVREYPVLVLGDLVLVRLGSGAGCGLSRDAQSLSESHFFSGVVEVFAKVPPSYVIENAFDEMHFGPVHDVVDVREFEVETRKSGALVARSRLSVPPSRWQRTKSGQRYVDVPFRTVAYSPSFVITYMGGSRPYVVLTGATGAGSGPSIIRLAVAVPKLDGEMPVEDIEYLLQQGVAGLKNDRVIWESLCLDFNSNFQSRDIAVKAFQEFCKIFN